MKTYNNYFLVIDVETGGLPDRLKKSAVYEIAITQIAVIVVDNESLQIVDQYVATIAPYEENLIYTAEAAEKTGIDKKFCEENGRNIISVQKDFIELARKYKRGRRKPILVGHNICSFDGEWISNLLNYKATKSSKHTVDVLFDNMVIDTLEWCRLMYVRNEAFKLEDCCRLANVTLEDAHKAESDALATANILIHLVKSLRNKSGGTNTDAIDFTPRLNFSL